jgi:cell division protein ZapA
MSDIDRESRRLDAAIRRLEGAVDGLLARAGDPDVVAAEMAALVSDRERLAEELDASLARETELQGWRTKPVRPLARQLKKCVLPSARRAEGMAKADITLRGRNYSIACAPGQEARIVALSQQLDARVKHIASAVGDIGEDRLLLITALALLDELDSARQHGRVLPCCGAKGSRGDGVGVRADRSACRPAGIRRLRRDRQGATLSRLSPRGSPAYVRVITRPERRHDMQMLITILFTAPWRPCWSYWASASQTSPAPTRTSPAAPTS